MPDVPTGFGIYFASGVQNNAPSRPTPFWLMPKPDERDTSNLEQANHSTAPGLGSACGAADTPCQSPALRSTAGSLNVLLHRAGLHDLLHARGGGHRAGIFRFSVGQGHQSHAWAETA